MGGVAVSSLQGTGNLPPNSELSGPNVNCAEVEKPQSTIGYLDP